ncbi:AMP-binding protein, partial [Lactococcus petauri]|uniref:AMP-binding protein n=1 Tax=Lactococcus petauri TaxID=1940789 RepID=UPI0021F1924E
LLKQTNKQPKRYGSTETQRAVGYYEVPSNQEAFDELKEVIPCGVGMKGAEVFVINNDGKQAGIGEMGEIYVRSHYMALGYFV